MLEKWKQQQSIIFLLQCQEHYVVVRLEIGGDYWVATGTGDDVYDELDMVVWKETVHFIANQFGVNNRTTVVFKTCRLLLAPNILNPPLQMVFIQIQDA